MGIGLVKGTSSLFVQEEVTEGTHVDPASAATALEVLESGLEMTSSREKIERNTLSATVETEAPRFGLKTVSGTVPCELKAAGTAGAAPPFDLLLKSLLGGKRSRGTTITTKSSGNTSTVLQIEDADIADLNVGDIVLVKKAGAFEVRPIISKTTGTGTASVTLAFALEGGAPGASVVLEKFTTYFPDDGWITLSTDYFAGGEIRESASGMRALTASIENWTTGQVPTMQFGLEGIEFAQTVEAPAYTPDFSADALPPVLLEACAYLGGVHIDYNEFKLSIENTKADIASACQASGKAGTRITNLKVSGNINPYKEDDDVTRFTNFEAGTSTSLFVFAFNPKATPVAGEGRQYVCIWIPNLKISEIVDGDVDGVITDEIAFDAFKNSGNDTIFMGFI